jgi:chitin disaccharide deacetylase
MNEASSCGVRAACRPSSSRIGQRCLIVNADDFGLSAGVNAGIVEAHEHGVVTSASLMVRAPAAPEAAQYAHRHPELSLGLHVDLEEWICRNGSWEPLYELVPGHDTRAVKDEVCRQWDDFRALLGRNPTHVDSHQHVHRREPVRTIVAEMAGAIGVPLRDFTAEIHYCGDFYGQTGAGAAWPEGITTEALVAMIVGLAAGVTELGCHPGWDDALSSMYARQRRQEVNALCAPAVRAAIEAEGIRLISFAELSVSTGR